MSTTYSDSRYTYRVHAGHPGFVAHALLRAEPALVPALGLIRMTRPILNANLAALILACAAFGQTTPAPAFEVASIRLSNMKAGGPVEFPPGGRFRATVWVKYLIELAYDVKHYQVSGGPAWLTTDRYVIQAKAENSDASKSEIKMMLQSLLADRFKLKLRRETKEFPVYALVVGKNGPKLTRLKKGEYGTCTGDNSFACGLRTIAALVDGIKTFAGRPVLDRTGLEGEFDLKLDFDEYSARGETPPPDYSKPSLFKAVQEQLGLRLEPQKAALPVLVIENVQRPTEN